MFELIYTSYPRGLQSGTSGFTSVAYTEGIPRRYIQLCESLSGYPFLYPVGHPEYEKNPVIYSHCRLGSEIPENQNGSSESDAVSILSRISACERDYTGRENKIAHHIVLTGEEIFLHTPGPASALMYEDLFIESWNREPTLLPGISFQEKIKKINRSATAEDSRSLSDIPRFGDAADALAQSAEKNLSIPSFILFDKDESAEPLLFLAGQALNRIETGMRWFVTLNTYSISRPVDSDCLWRFTPVGSGSEPGTSSPGTSSSDPFSYYRNRYPSSLVIDLRSGRIGEGNTGRVKRELISSSGAAGRISGDENGETSGSDSEDSSLSLQDGDQSSDAAVLSEIAPSKEQALKNQLSKDLSLKDQPSNDSLSDASMVGGSEDADTSGTENIRSSSSESSCMIMPGISCIWIVSAAALLFYLLFPGDRYPDNAGIMNSRVNSLAEHSTATMSESDNLRDKQSVEHEKTESSQHEDSNPAASNGKKISRISINDKKSRLYFLDGRLYDLETDSSTALAASHSAEHPSFFSTGSDLKKSEFRIVERSGMEIDVDFEKPVAGDMPGWDLVDRVTGRSIGNVQEDKVSIYDRSAYSMAYMDVDREEYSNLIWIGAINLQYSELRQSDQPDTVEIVFDDSTSDLLFSLLHMLSAENLEGVVELKQIDDNAQESVIIRSECRFRNLKDRKFPVLQLVFGHDQFGSLMDRMSANGEKKESGNTDNHSGAKINNFSSVRDVVNDFRIICRKGRDGGEFTVLCLTCRAGRD